MSQFSARRLLRDGSRLLAGHVIGAIGVIVGIRLMTEMLTPEQYGAAALMIGLVSLHTGLFPLPVAQALGRFWPSVPSARQGALQLEASRLLRVPVGLASVVFALGVCVEGALSGTATPGGTALLAVATVLLVVAESLRAHEQAISVAQRRSLMVAVWQGSEAWLRPIMALGLICLVPGASVAGVLTGYALATGLLALWVRQRQHRPGEPAPDIRARLIRFSLPLMPLAIIGWVNGLADRYLIGALIDLRSVGLYAAVYGLSARPLRILGVVAAHTFRPAYYQALAAGRTAVANRLLALWFWLLAGALVAVTLLMWLLADSLARWLLAAEYRDTAWLSPVLSAAHIPLLLATVAEVVSLANDRPRNMTIAEGSGALATLVLVAPLLIWLGLPGAAIATAVAYTLQCAVAWWLAARASRQPMRQPQSATSSIT